jgi:RimJ/RimL family protein N-acetyltransferase
MQGKGIVTKSVKRLIHYGFKHLNLNRILIRVSTQNIGSKRVAQRLNFTYEGTLRSDFIINDEFVDMEIYGLLKSEWEILEE